MSCRALIGSAGLFLLRWCIHCYRRPLRWGRCFKVSQLILTMLPILLRLVFLRPCPQAKFSRFKSRIPWQPRNCRLKLRISRWDAVLSLALNAPSRDRVSHWWSSSHLKGLLLKRWDWPARGTKPRRVEFFQQPLLKCCFELSRL